MVERKNSLYVFVINIKLKLNIFFVWENILDFEKDEKKFLKYEI